MNWRPWIILALLLGVVVVNSALMWFEEVAGPEAVAEVIDQVKDPLASVPFTPGTRITNFAAFGLPEDLVEAATDEAKRIHAHKDRLQELLKEHAEDVGPALCPSELPQRYAALSFLVEEKDGKRDVVDFSRTTYFERKEWFDEALVREVYSEVDRNPEGPRDNATAMGVAAILLGKESAVLEGTAPWGAGLGRRWSLERVFTEFPEAKRMLVRYFAFMHVLTELANEQERGICG